MILDYLSFTEWKTKKQILTEMENNDFLMNERELRKSFENNNKRYAEGQVDFYIIHSIKGYKKTFNHDEIRNSITNNRKRAITMLIQANKTEKQMLRNMHIKMTLGK